MVSLRNIDIGNDINIVYDCFSIYEQQKLISNRVIVKSKEDFKNWFVFQLKNYYHEFRIIEENKVAIGFCYSYDFFQDILKTVLYIKPEYQNSGAGVIAELLFLDELFRFYPLRKIYNHVYSYNSQSLKSHFSAGFVKEGVLKEYRYYDGEYHDVYIMSLSRQDFKNRLYPLLKRKEVSKNV